MTIVLSSLIASSISIASENQGSILLKNNPNPQATSVYWTPDRMRNAQPFDLPQVDPAALRKISIEELQQRQHGLTPIIHLGTPPSLSIPPDTHQLFKPAAHMITKPLDAGTLEEQFSSQQLVPLSADQSYPYTTVGKLFFTKCLTAKNYLCFNESSLNVMGGHHQGGVSFWAITEPVERVEYIS